RGNRLLLFRKTDHQPGHLETAARQLLLSRHYQAERAPGQGKGLPVHLIRQDNAAVGKAAVQLREGEQYFVAVRAFHQQVPGQVLSPQQLAGSDARALQYVLYGYACIGVRSTLVVLQRSCSAWYCSQVCGTQGQWR